MFIFMQSNAPNLEFHLQVFQLQSFFHSLRSRVVFLGFYFRWATIAMNNSNLLGYPMDGWSGLFPHRMGLILWWLTLKAETFFVILTVLWTQYFHPCPAEKKKNLLDWLSHPQSSNVLWFSLSFCLDGL